MIQVCVKKIESGYDKKRNLHVLFIVMISHKSRSDFTEITISDFKHFCNITGGVGALAGKHTTTVHITVVKL